MEIIEAKSRQTYDPEGQEVNLGRQRVTDCQYNTRVYLPKPMAAHKEAMVAVRTSEWSRVRTMFKDANTNDKGEQKTNLTASQKRGLLSLLRRIKSGEIVVIETDKSGRFAVMTIEDYLAAGTIHTAKDEEFIKNNQRISRSAKGVLTYP